jgi:hypothetical protein
MRPLWRLESAVLEMIADQHPASALALREQMKSMVVTGFHNSGAGFFSDLEVDASAPVVFEPLSPLMGPSVAIAGIPNGMGFLLFLKARRAACLEGFCYGEFDTHDFDFARATSALNENLAS